MVEVDKRTSCAVVKIEDLKLIQRWIKDASSQRTWFPYLHSDLDRVLNILDDAINPLENFELVVPQAQLDDANEHLENSKSFNRSDDCVYCWTADIGRDGLEVDVKVVDADEEGGGPWTEAVLFQDGHEIQCTDVAETIEGKWIFRDYRICVNVKGDGNDNGV